MGYVPIYSLDVARVVSLVPLRVAIQLKKRAAAKGKTLSSYISTVLYSATLGDPWTEDDEKLRAAMVEENRRKRKKIQDRLHERQNKKKKGA